MRAIEIDFEVHLIIENARRGFEDTPNAVLRRLLGLEDGRDSEEPYKGHQPDSRKAEVRRLYDERGPEAAMHWGLENDLAKGTLQSWMSSWAAAKKRGWRGDGVELPNGTYVRMSYSGRDHEGEIVEGLWVVEGKTFTSPSGAAGGVALTKAGKRTRLDGWMYWHVRRPGDTDWICLNDLRPKTDLTNLKVEAS